jgi:membrane-associated protein
VITASVLAAHGHLWIWLIVPLAALGAFVGDNVSYALGHFFGDPLATRLFRGESGRRRLDWARAALDRRGATIIVVARFVPGGRTAVTFAAGTLEFPWRRFARYDALAVLIWATYSGMLGYIGGSTFEHSTWKALVLAFGLAAAIALVLELVRRLKARAGGRAPGF